MEWNRQIFGVVGLVCWVSICSHAQSLHEKIDGWIDRGNTGHPVAALSDDAEFFRRINLDFTGVIPTPDEVKTFLADPAPDKREKAINRLLGDTGSYARRMRELFDVHLMERRGVNGMWEAWLEKSFAENKPWDEMTREIIRADFRDEANRGAAYFYTNRLEKTGQNVTDYSGLTRDVGRLFLGMDLQCAECHNHLLIDDYKQIDFQGLFAGFSNLNLLREEYPAVEEKLMQAKLGYASVFTGKQREVAPRVPGLDEVVVPAFAKGEEYFQAPDRKTKAPGIPKFSPLDGFASQIPRSPNFSKNIANRLWFEMMGRGIVEPLDQFHSENPPSHPELIDLLGREFTEHGYDIKWLLHEIALTKTYQRSSRLPGNGDVPPERFAVATQRRLSAEQLMWSTTRATGAPSAGAEVAELRKKFRDAMGNDPREPELEFSPSVKGALFMMNDPEILKLAGSLAEQDQSIEDLYLRIFSRMPQPVELAEWNEFLSGAKDRREALGDLVWAMLTSTEFVVNH